MGNDNSAIIRLEGPDRVRKRPANIFYSDGIEGVLKVITSLLDIFVTEASLGFSSNIRVNFHADNSISVRSFDRGFIFDETVINRHPAWYYDFCEIFPEPHEVVDNYRFCVGSKHNDLYGKLEIPMPKYQADSDHAYNISFVQYVSEFMHVESTRNGTKKMLDFKKGYNVSDLCKEQTFESSNTYIHFLIDHEVFNYTYLPTDEIAKFLKNAAITIPGLKCEICNEQDNSNRTFLYPNGSEDYAEEIINSAVIPLFK